MTEKKKERIDEGYRQWEKRPLSLIILASVFVLLIILLFILSGSGGRWLLSCSLADSHNENMKISWLKSDNVSSYEDIPIEEKKNLSDESVRWLNISALNDTDSRVREYNPVEYKDLSEEEKKVFNDSLHSGVYFDGSDWYRNSSFGTESDKILYQGDIYQCTLSTQE